MKPRMRISARSAASARPAASARWAISARSVLSMLGLLAALVLSSTPAQGQADWTYMVYLDADNNLEAAGIDDFLEMASVGSDAQVNVLVLFDRTPNSSSGGGYSSAYGDWTDTRRGIVNPGDVPNTSWGISMGELNMGDPQTLIDFVVWGMQAHPASNYAVVLWDHGSGWRDARPRKPFPVKWVCADETDVDYLYVSELGGALESIESTEQQLDLIGFDACLMAMVEVAYEIREGGDVMVGSEKTEPNDGWPYDTILADLTSDPTMSPTELGEVIVDRYYDSYGGSETHSAILLGGSLQEALADKVNDLAEALITCWEDDPAHCAAMAYQLKQGLETAIHYERHGTAWPGSHGLAIYFPQNGSEFDATYNGTTIQFPNATLWEEFLQEFYATMTGWPVLTRAQTQEYESGVNLAGDPVYHHIDLYNFCAKIIANAPGDMVWVDFGYSGPEFGTYDMPYNTLLEGVAAAAGSVTVYVKPGHSIEVLMLNTPARIRGWGGGGTIG